ncbi:MAG: hypothetical protein QW609_01450 [Candidatus Aenigmatarchaeota archaeon]
MKGQAFLIVAIIFVTILALIKINASFPHIKEDKTIFFEFENVKEEMIKSVEFSLYEKENITKNLENFADFARSFFRRKALNLNLLLLEVLAENGNLNISLKNLLGNDIIFLNITLNNSFSEFGKIEDGEKVNTNFTLPAENANYTLKIYYETPFSKEKEEVLVEAETGKTKLIVFFEIILEKEKTKLRDKVLKHYELN